MKRGRKAKPTRLKVIQGNPGKRPIEPDAAKPETKIPPCPPHLDAVARKEWKRVAEELRKLGLISAVSMAALAVYAAAWSRWIAAERQIKKAGGPLQKTPNGYMQISPWLVISNKAQDQMLRVMAEFGMTPASQSRANAAQAEFDFGDDFGDYLGRGRGAA